MGFDICDFQSRKKRHQKINQLNIDQSGLNTKDLGINLVKLPVPALLGPFATKHGANRVKFLDRVLGIQTMLYVGPRNRSRSFRTKGDQVAFAIRKGIHLLFDNVGIFPDASGKKLGPLHNGNPDLFEAKILQKLTRNCFNSLPELNFTGKNIFKSPD